MQLLPAGRVLIGRLCCCWRALQVLTPRLPLPHCPPRSYNAAGGFETAAGFDAATGFEAAAAPAAAPEAFAPAAAPEYPAAGY